MTAAVRKWEKMKEINKSLVRWFQGQGKQFFEDWKRVRTREDGAACGWKEVLTELEKQGALDLARAKGSRGGDLLGCPLERSMMRKFCAAATGPRSRGPLTCSS